MYADIPDHPVIRNMERTGYPDGKVPFQPVCPVCGCECSVVYTDSLNEIIGCDECIEKSYDDDLMDEPCPQCGNQPEFCVYVKDDEVVGCDNCLEEEDAYERLAPERC